jgi:hypothetical protein
MTAPAAVQQILFDALAGQSGGAGQLSPDEIAPGSRRAASFSNQPFDADATSQFEPFAHQYIEIACQWTWLNTITDRTCRVGCRHWKIEPFNGSSTVTAHRSAQRSPPRYATPCPTPSQQPQEQSA